MSQDTPEVVRWLSSFPDTERGGQFVDDGEGSLNREHALLEQLGNPQQAYTITHVTGTKGKGLTSAMLAAILQAAGMRTGRFPVLDGFGSDGPSRGGEGGGQLKRANLDDPLGLRPCRARSSFDIGICIMSDRSFPNRDGHESSRQDEHYGVPFLFLVWVPHH